MDAGSSLPTSVELWNTLIADGPTNEKLDEAYLKKLKKQKEIEELQQKVEPLLVKDPFGRFDKKIFEVLPEEYLQSVLDDHMKD